MMDIFFTIIAAFIAFCAGVSMGVKAGKDATVLKERPCIVYEGKVYCPEVKGDSR